MSGRNAGGDRPSGAAIGATLLGVFAAIGASIAANFLHEMNWLWFGFAATASFVVAVAAVWRAGIALTIHDIEEEPRDVKAHGAVILALSLVPEGERAQAQVDANNVEELVKELPDQGPDARWQLLDDLANEPSIKNIRRGLKQKHPWQAMIKALLPHMTDLDNEKKRRVPPIFVLTSLQAGNDPGSSEQFEAFSRAFTNMLQVFEFNGIEERKVADFEKFDSTRNELGALYRKASRAARNAPEGVQRTPIIDITGAPRPFAIAATSLVLAGEAERFTYVSQSDGQLRQYRLEASQEKTINATG